MPFPRLTSSAGTSTGVTPRPSTRDLASMANPSDHSLSRESTRSSISSRSLQRVKTFGSRLKFWNSRSRSSLRNTETNDSTNSRSSQRSRSRAPSGVRGIHERSISPPTKEEKRSFRRIALEHMSSLDNPSMYSHSSV